MSLEEIQIILTKLEEKQDFFIELAKDNHNIIPKELNVAYFQVIKAIEDFSTDQNKAITLWIKRLNSIINIELLELELKAWQHKNSPDRIPVANNKFILRVDLETYNALKTKKPDSSIIPDLSEKLINRIILISKIIYGIELEAKKITQRSGNEKNLLPSKDGNLVSKEFLNYYNYINTFKENLERELDSGIATDAQIPENISFLAKNFINERKKEQTLKRSEVIKLAETKTSTEKIKLIYKIKNIASKYLNEDLTNWSMKSIFHAMRDKLPTMKKEDLENYSNLVKKINDITIEEKTKQQLKKPVAEQDKLIEYMAWINNEIAKIEKKYFLNEINPDFPAAVADNGMLVCFEDIERYNYLWVELIKCKETLYRKFPQNNTTVAEYLKAI